MKREIYIGDNLYHLRLGEQIAPESVDLVYLDPPFKSDRQYNTLFARRVGARAAAQERAFEDTWRWNPAAEHACQIMMQTPGKLGEAIAALYRLLGDVPMMAYIAMMAPRLVELRRVLKPTGSIYLHCDSTASHYLKILMDAVFRPEQFLSEVIWRRTGTHSSALRWGPVHDTLLMYAKKRGRQIWNGLYQPFSERHRRRHYRRVDSEGRPYELGELTGPGVRHGRSGEPWRGFDVTALGRHWITTVDRLEELYEAKKIVFPDRGGWPRLIRYEKDSKGRAIGDVWEDIPPLNMKARERVGFPTQKPNALLRRIIEASSNPGDLVLDPFCGCGTAIIVAEQLQRQWIGIDITDVALDVIKLRLKREVGDVPYVVKAIEPRALPEAIALARKSRKEFETWALSLVGVRPAEPHQGADRGVDARFLDVHGRPVVVSVKSGKVTVSQLRDLRGVVDRERAVVGAFITLYQPTKAMVREAATAGAYESPTGLVPRIQILTIAQLLDPNSRGIVFPPAAAAISQESRDRRKRATDQFPLPLTVATPEAAAAARLPRQEVPTAPPPPHAARRGRSVQFAIEHVEEAVPWQLSGRPPAKAPSRRAAAAGPRRRASRTA